MSENVIAHYCLGNGELKCDGCKQEKNWQMLNQLPDTTRRAMQAQAQRIDATDCILSGRPWYTGEHETLTATKYQLVIHYELCNEKVVAEFDTLQDAYCAKCEQFVPSEWDELCVTILKDGEEVC